MPHLLLSKQCLQVMILIENQMNRIEHIQEVLKPLRETLSAHPVYQNLKSIDDVKLFMELHSYAVWDFMSLIKHLQIKLTCVSLPWMPATNPTLARFVNEIVHAEESDINEQGIPISHFEMYLDAMREIGASTTGINQLMKSIKQGMTVKEVLTGLNIPQAVKDFVNYTFDIIGHNEGHKTAASFTFGREDVIPDMFIEIINQSNTRGKNYDKLRYYLERHVELDGDEHGPLSLQLVSELCGDDDSKWEEATHIAQQSLQHRIHLWDAINDLINKSKTEKLKLSLH